MFGPTVQFKLDAGSACVAGLEHNNEMKTHLCEQPVLTSLQGFPNDVLKHVQVCPMLLLHYAAAQSLDVNVFYSFSTRVHHLL